MKEKIDYKENLWFEHLGCEGKHYLIGNPHTFPGRMWAWCPKKERTFFVSKSEMGSMSEQAESWIKGFLSGNQPSPPTNEEGDVDFDSKEYKTWSKAAELFLDTGYWWSGEVRKCENCETELLASELEDICSECQK